MFDRSSEPAVISLPLRYPALPCLLLRVAGCSELAQPSPAQPLKQSINHSLLALAARRRALLHQPSLTYTKGDGKPPRKQPPCSVHQLSSAQPGQIPSISLQCSAVQLGPTAAAAAAARTLHVSISHIEPVCPHIHTPNPRLSLSHQGPRSQVQVHQGLLPNRPPATPPTGPLLNTLLLLPLPQSTTPATPVVLASLHGATLSGQLNTDTLAHHSSPQNRLQRAQHTQSLALAQRLGSPAITQCPSQDRVSPCFVLIAAASGQHHRLCRPDLNS